MKTFLEFITEAELIENDQQEFAKLRAEIQMLQRRDRPGDAEKVKELIQRVAELQMGTQAKIGAQLNKDKPQEPTNPNSKVVGYASKPKDVVSKVGTTSDVQRTDIEQEPDVITGSRYKKPGSSGGRGTNIGRSGSTLGTKSGNR